MDKEFFGTALALMAAVISGFAIPLNKIFVVDLDPAVFTAIRALVIGLVFLTISFLRKDVSLRSIRKMPLGYLLAIGIIGGGVAFLMYFTGLQLTTAGRAAFLQKTLPIYATVFAFFLLKERIKKKQLYALLVMLAGAFAMLLTQVTPSVFWSDPSLGDALVLGATVLWALENVLAKKAMLKESNLVVSFARMFFGSLVLFAAVVLMNKTATIFTLTGQQAMNLMMSTGILFGYVLFWYWSLKYINVSKASGLLLVAPVISLLLGVFFLGEPAPLLQLAASALILAGAVFMASVRSEFSN
jgi:drug/metabolite transporter (DMT)-like permease